MLIRTLPLTAGIAPFLATWLAYWLGVHNDVLPTCIPFLDGCTSISATGRTMPGSLLFRAVMLPQAILLTFVWYFSARWLQNLAPSSKAVNTIIWAGLVGSISLVLYVTFLGTKAPFYEFMRRFGIYFYFLGTAVAQLTLAIALFRHVKRNSMPSLKRLTLVMLWLISLPFALGVLNIILKSTLANADAAENQIEWIAAMLMQAYFVVLYFAWRTTEFSIEVTTR